MQINLGAKAFLFLTVLLSGCVAGNGDEGAGAGKQKATDSTGIFQAGNVAGLGYATPTQSGVTESNGTFRYRTGETVRFTVDGLEL
jgi:hypothetical protein